MTFSRAQFDRAFNPRVVAVVGDKLMNGFLWLHALKAFNGKLYSVQIDPNEIPAIEALGVTNVASLLDIPEPVDYVVLAVPRQVAPRVLDDCVTKAVGAVTLFTAGFSETGEAEGERLEQQIVTIAQRGRLLLVGPNCMGLANPRLGLCNFPNQPAGESAAGHVGFLGQSGTHTINFVMRAPGRGVGISKAASIGNASVVDACDYLEYLRDDPDTSAIAMYVEGVRNGRRFFEVLRATTRVKPVVIWKGGQSGAGQRAIFSHTAALATPTAVWTGMLRQAGAVSADGLDELIDIVAALQTGKTATGGRAGLIAMTGGPSVALTDAFTRTGLDVPLLSDASYARLREFFNVVGGSFRNPLDAGSTIAMGFRIDNLEKLLDILDAEAGIDVIAVDLGAGLAVDRWREISAGLTGMLELLAGFAARSSKPLAVIIEPAHREAEIAAVRSQFIVRGLLALPSAERAAVALRKLVEHHRFRAGTD
ncbi:MAG: CoA-binding protein [Deltaproteobacteria bacterium]|nr:CoA-binding protein [Deltaproteobacteria bacterium]MBI3390161.1 CoA-binding protein [Deltaproteobacteria bacterium]